MKKEIKILGAGISGLTAAINLAKAGYKVEIFERNKNVGMRLHGDIQGIENWTEDRDALVHMKDMNLELNFDYDILNYLKISNNKKSWRLNFLRPACYLIKRGVVKGSLDLGLKKQALNSGVKIHFHSSIPERNADIIATGPDMKKLFGIDKGIIFKTSHKDLFMSLLNKKEAYQGYSYLLIIKGYACLATCIGGDFKKIDKYLEKSEEMFERITKLKIKKPRMVGGVGSFRLNPVYEKKGKLYVGEAAGFQDLMLGFGMRNAMVSGYLAAKSIIEKKDYEILAKEYFEKKLKASIVNRYLFDIFSKKDYTYFLDKLNKSKDILGLLKSYYNYNLLQKILFPFALVHCRKEYPKLDF